MDKSTIEKISQMKAQTEELLRLATLDDPVETRELLEDMAANLPIAVRLNEHGLNSLREQGKYIKNREQALLIEDVIYTGDLGGILCVIKCEIDDEHSKELLMTSITHLKIDPSHPLLERIKHYQKKRMLSIAIADSGKSRNRIKPKKKKRGFGH